MTITQELSIYLNYTYNEIVDLKQNGRITDRLYRHYMFFWQWSAFRFSSGPQERYYNKYGIDKLEQRIKRVNKIIERIRAVPMPAPGHIPFAVGALNP